MNWFTVDKKGLAALLEKRGKSWIIFELIQNAWDEEGVSRVDVTVTPVERRPFCDIIVRDDAPEGFRDLSHAWTLFAESYKKSNPDQRGRFNLGEKLVLALAEEATITSTKGTVVFDKDGRHAKRTTTQAGTVFAARIRMTHPEADDLLYQANLLLPPAHIATTINGLPIKASQPEAVIECALPTVLADAEGHLTRTTRKTRVEVYNPHLIGSIAPETMRDFSHLYEMGIPVCSLEGDEQWSYNVMQKVPLNMERDMVSPAYLRALHVAVLNTMHRQVANPTAAWVRDAADDQRCAPEAIATVLDKRFGAKRVSFDPSDAEANKRAVAAGYTVVPGASLSAGEWENARRAQAIAPAGQVTPSPKPYSDDPNAPPVEVIDHTKVSAQWDVVLYCEQLGALLLGDIPTVRVVLAGLNFSAAYGDSTLDLNLRRLGKDFFVRCADEQTAHVDQLHQLLIHEFAHHFEMDHLSSKYHEACCRLGAKLARIALDGELPKWRHGC